MRNESPPRNKLTRVQALEAFHSASERLRERFSERRSWVSEQAELLGALDDMAQAEALREQQMRQRPDGDTPLYCTNARICGPCLDGVGEQCHTPGCAFIWLAPPVFAEKPLAHAGGTLRQVLSGAGAYISETDGAPRHEHENCAATCPYGEEDE